MKKPKPTKSKANSPESLRRKQLLLRRKQLLSWREPLGLTALVAVALFFLATSWRKWPDTLVDFGRELYLPWRLAQGAVLYRDVDNFFGPLSQYANACVFALAGPGLMVLVAANLAVFAAILAGIYILFRSAWGVSAALVSAVVFVAVYGFSQYVAIGNYNYVTPYAHEVTHGFLVCLLLTGVLHRWVQHPTLLHTSLAGGLFGLTALLKAEIMLAAGLVTLTAVAIRLRQRVPIELRTLSLWAISAVVPTAGFALYFSGHVSLKEAMALACRAWMNVSTTTRLTGESIQLRFLGLDRPWQHLVEHATATLEALLLVAGIGGIAWLADRPRDAWLRFLIGGTLAGGVTWVACFGINWNSVGRCLLGFALIYILICAASLIRGSASDRSPARDGRLLVAVLAAALMARMLLNGRIYHYGFYQAALAGILPPAVLIGELPERLRLGRWGRAIVATCTILLLLPGVLTLEAHSQELLRLKTYAVGEGVDRLYTFPPTVEPTGAIVRTINDWLRARPPGRTLLVLPEGEMINYLTRLPSPVAPVIFYSAVTRGGGEEVVVRKLSQHPPDWVAIIARDLREFGIERYGEGPGNGGQILAWVRERYEPVLSVGGDPLDFRQHGGIVLKRKAASAY